MTPNGKDKKILNQAEVSILFAAARQEAELRELRESNGMLTEILTQARTALES